MVGTTISHYKITEKLGEGGMGVVYKAQDTSLERPVALKFLAPHLVSDEEVRKRFEREAKAAAALNHPNVCTVHEIAEANGRTFIAMAFIEGDSLETKIEAGPLKLKDALDIAIQTVQGLQAAHDKNIVHRDIKPANLMVTGEGAKQLVTIMDFGLALLTDRSKLTQKDETMGTVTYMSPEQAQGMELDYHTDIWSLGAVIYEMVTGQKAFKGHYDQATVYSILNEQPEPMTALRTGVPMELELLVNKCLAKEADRRYQSTADMVVDLESLSDKLKSDKSTILKPQVGSQTVATELVDATHSPSDHPLARYRVIENLEEKDNSVVYRAEDTQLHRSVAIRVLPEDEAARAEQKQRRKQLTLISLALTSVLVAAGIAALWLYRTPSQPQSMRFTIDAPEGVTIGSAQADGPPILSPDGRSLAFVGYQEGYEERIWNYSLLTEESRPLAGTEGAQYPFWSPDSRYLGFFAQGKLKKIDVSGGSPLALCDAPSGRGGTWARTEDGDGVIVFAPLSGSGLAHVSAAGGEPVPITTPDESQGENNHRQPHFLPDGKHFLYVSNNDDDTKDAIFAGSLHSTESKLVLNAGSKATYVPPTSWHTGGYLLFVRESTLMAQAFDADRIEPTGDPFPIAEEIDSGGNRHVGDFSASENGLLTYRRGGVSNETQLVWMDRDSGKRSGAVAEPGAYEMPRLSPDGSKLAVARTDTQTDNTDIFVFDLETGASPTRLTFHEARDTLPVWSPDGREIVFHSGRDGQARMYRKVASGSEEAELVSDAGASPSTWSGDGRTLLYKSVPEETRGLWTLRLFGDLQPTVLVRLERVPFSGTLSPDGRWLAYMSTDSGRHTTYIEPVPPTGAKWVVCTPRLRQR